MVRRLEYSIKSLDADIKKDEDTIKRQNARGRIKEFIRTKRKAEAKMFCKALRCQQDNLAKLYQTKINLEQVYHTIRVQADNKKIVQAIKEANAVLRENLASMDEAHDVMDQMREHVEEASEFDALMASGGSSALTVEDEEDIERELAMMNDEELLARETGFLSEPVISTRTVPVTHQTLSTSFQTASQSRSSPLPHPPSSTIAAHDTVASLEDRLLALNRETSQELLDLPEH